MSIPILHVKPEEIDNTEKRRRYKICIIGCGRNGVLHAYLFAEAGFKIICVDANRAVVSNLAKGKTPFLRRKIEPLLKKHVRNGCLSATNDVEKAVAQSDVILIMTRAEIDRKKKVNYLDLEKTCKHVGSSLRRGSLIIIMSIIGPTAAEGLIRENLENTSGFKAGVDFGLAFSPVRRVDEQTPERLAECKRIAAATDKDSLNAASTVLGTITKEGVVETSDVKTAEAATLFEAVHHYTSIALANELARFCEKAHIDYLKAREIAEASACSLLVLPTVVGGSIRD
ncbi:hypothetical protein KAW04_04390, partial [Candidatus Bathyarchaeota archaeon]|nr:hypothetical protein [Candidatus Bathyarchaeota archaeon]